MTTIPPVPSQSMTTSWGDLTATCDHPHRVHFHTGTDGAQPMTIDGFSYVAGLTVHRDGPGDPNPRERIPLSAGWYTLAADAWLALSQLNGVAAVTRHQQAFIDAVLPDLAGWLATSPAADLVAEGTAYWRRQCATRAANTEADLAQAHTRVRRIADAIAAGQIPTAADEQYLRQARVHPR